MNQKYKKFADEFEQLCEKYASDDFDLNEVLEVCKKVASIYAE